MKTLLITIAIATACLSGCATSASSTWNCSDGTCIPKYTLNSDNGKMASMSVAHKDNSVVAFAKALK